MKMLLVRGYKDARDYDFLPVPSHHDARVNDDIAKFIERALEAAGLTEAEIISMSVVPSLGNGRDPGSSDYYILCRNPKQSK